MCMAIFKKFYFAAMSVVSVLLPVYNGEQFLRDALDSIITQRSSLSDIGLQLEIVVVDDGSTDSTPMIIHEYKQTYPECIRAIRFDQNRGIVQALNCAIENCSGEYIARMDSDDISASNRLQRQIQFLQSNTDVDIVGGFFELFDSQARNPPRIVEHPCEVGRVHASMFFSCVLGHPTVLARRRVFTHPLRYEADFQYAEDFRLWLQVITCTPFKIANLPAPSVLKLRIHKGRASSIQRSLQKKRSLAAVQAAIQTCIDTYASENPTLQRPSFSLTPELVAAFVEPSRNADPLLIQPVSELYEIVEKFLLTRPHFSEDDKKHIAMEFTSRLGEIATTELRITGKPPSACSSLRKWLSRNPADQLMRLLHLASVQMPPKPQRRKRQLDVVTVICFSKDRAFQLKEYLRTLFAYIKNVTLNVKVLWTTSTQQFHESYVQLQQKFPEVQFIEENNFASQLKELTVNADDFILWGVDDVFYYNPVDLRPFLMEMDRNDDILVSHLRLSPNITYCHPSDAYSVLPEFHVIEGNDDILKFDRTIATQDWNYPFELCATLMRKEDVVETLEGIEKLFGKEALSHPNKLEVSGARLFSRKLHPKSSLKWCLCVKHPVLSVITVNRVQDVCENRVYEQVSLEELDNLFRLNKQLDETYYRNHTFNSVHIGDFVLER